MHLKRKARRNVVKTVNRVERIKRLNSKPNLKNIDVQEIKKQFREEKGGDSKPAEQAES